MNKMTKGKDSLIIKDATDLVIIRSLLTTQSRDITPEPLENPAAISGQNKERNSFFDSMQNRKMHESSVESSYLVLQAAS